MKILKLPALALCVWLAGCATQSDNTRVGTPGSMPSVAVTELHSDAVAPLTTPADLWDRIRRGFAIPDLDSEAVRQQQAWYLDHADYIQRMTERSRLYLFHIVEQLELRDMPTELALLPYVESSFNPQAVSSAKAAGLWQFIPSTGKSFDLEQNVLRDERRNVVASTRAALDYLQQLHDQFGDWQLALAAYNWGPGNVGRAIERNAANGLGTGYTDLSMPAETRQYVPKLQAVENIIANPQAFGVALPDIGNHPFFTTVAITRDMDIAVAARLARVSLKDFKALNPSQKKSTIFAAGTPQILLPWDNATIFKENLAKADPDTLASWALWVAPQNTTARQVASRIGMAEDTLRRLNAMGRRTRIRKGATVLVANARRAPEPATASVVENVQVAYTAADVLHRTVVQARRGDSIAKLAERYDLPAATVAGWNKTPIHDALDSGQKVVLYLPDGHHAAPTPANPQKRPPVKRDTTSGSKSKVAVRDRSQPAAASRQHAATKPAKTRVGAN